MDASRVITNPNSMHVHISLFLSLLLLVHSTIVELVWTESSEINFAFSYIKN